MIRFLFAKNNNLIEILRQLCEVFGEDVMTLLGCLNKTSDEFYSKISNKTVYSCSIGVSD